LRSPAASDLQPQLSARVEVSRPPTSRSNRHSSRAAAQLILVDNNRHLHPPLRGSGHTYWAIRWRTHRSERSRST
jgi:hypothetical protein